MSADVQQAIWIAIIFAAPVGTIVMHRHHATSRGWLRWFIVTLRILAIVSTPFALFTLLRARWW